MKNVRFLFKCLFILGFFYSFYLQSQVQQGHSNNNKFRQLYDQFADPNRYHNASGAPGVDYYQQKVDYEMEIELDDVNSRLYGEEIITYKNNSPDQLQYLWLQLDQNIRKKNAPNLDKNGFTDSGFEQSNSLVSNYLNDPFEGGFNIDWVHDSNGKNLPFTINQTMMRVDLPQAISPGDSYLFKIKCITIKNI